MCILLHCIIFIILLYYYYIIIYLLLLYYYYLLYYCIILYCILLHCMVSDEGFATSATGLRYVRTPMNYIGDGRRSSAMKSQETK